MNKTIKDLLALVDVTAPVSDEYNSPTWCGDASWFDDVFNGSLGWSKLFEERTKRHWADGACWIDTDEKVGLSFVSLDGEILAMYSKYHRSGRGTIEFLSSDAYYKMRKFYQDCMDDMGQNSYTICNLDEIVEDGWFRKAKTVL